MEYASENDKLEKTYRLCSRLGKFVPVLIPSGQMTISTFFYNRKILIIHYMPVSWVSIKQNVVATFTVEAKYRAMMEVTQLAVCTLTLAKKLNTVHKMITLEN